MRRLGHLTTLRRVVGALVLVLTIGTAGLLATDLPVHAHASSKTRSTNFRSQMTSIEPGFRDVALRVVDLGDKLYLMNRGEPVVVLGYDNEPYLRIEQGGVWENQNSPATYLNRDVYARVTVPPDVSPAAAPRWEKVSGSNSYSWHDHRIHWMSPIPPPIVRANSGQEHTLYDNWKVLFRQGEKDVVAAGNLKWVPGPNPLPWWLLIAAVGAIGLAGLTGWSRRGRARVVFAMLCLTLVGLDLARLAGVTLGGYGPAGLRVLETAYRVLPHLAGWLPLVWSVVRASRRRRLPLGLAAFGASVILVANFVSGVEDLGASQMIFAGPQTVGRALVAGALGCGVAVVMWWISDRVAGRADRRRQSHVHADDPVPLPHAN